VDFVCSCEANSLELWLTYCWPSLYAAITSTNRFVLTEIIHIICIIFDYYFACFKEIMTKLEFTSMILLSKNGVSGACQHHCI